MRLSQPIPFWCGKECPVTLFWDFVWVVTSAAPYCFLATAGTVLGAVASIFASRLLEDFLVDVTPLDQWVFLTVTPILFLVSMAASLIPALRAARLDPMRTLREQ